MSNALIGYTGFVGTTLLRQTPFDELYRSANIGDIAGRRFDTVVCAGAPGQKWLANREPQADRASIERLIGHLRTIACRRFVLISTVDVFARPQGVDEASPVDETELQAYGLHRRMLERFVEEQFPNSLIVRLPGLVGPGLRKNVIFDFQNQNNLHAMESRASFQFYPMVNLWHDIQIALDAGLPLVHLTAAPVTVAAISLEGFGRPFTQTLGGTPASYDMRSRHAALFGGNGSYQYGARETMLAVRAYAQTDPVTVPPVAEAGAA
ncbi:MAG TPA: pyridine nucleotide transhydrogenase [Telluria sp.]